MTKAKKSGVSKVGGVEVSESREMLAPLPQQDPKLTAIPGKLVVAANNESREIGPVVHKKKKRNRLGTDTEYQEEGNASDKENLDAMERSEEMKELFAHTRLFSKSVSEYKGYIAKNLKFQRKFNFMFISMALDTDMPSSCTCGPSLGLIMAIADVFGRTIDTPKWDKDGIYWQNLFDGKCTLESNPVVKMILEAYGGKYDCREPVGKGAGTPRASDGSFDAYTNMSNRIGQFAGDCIENESTKSHAVRKMFARFLVKLSDAKHASKEKIIQGRHKLGVLIRDLAKRDDSSFENLRLWGRTIIVPEKLKLLYPAAKSEKDDDVECEYESEKEETEAPLKSVAIQSSKGEFDVEAVEAELQRLQVEEATQASKNNAVIKQLREGQLKMEEYKQEIQNKKSVLAKQLFEKRCLEILYDMRQAFGDGITDIALNCIKEMASPVSWENGQAVNSLRNFLLHVGGEKAAGDFTIKISLEEALKFKAELAKSFSTPELLVEDDLVDDEEEKDKYDDNSSLDELEVDVILSNKDNPKKRRHEEMSKEDVVPNKKNARLSKQLLNPLISEDGVAVPMFLDTHINILSKEITSCDSNSSEIEKSGNEVGASSSSSLLLSQTTGEVSKGVVVTSCSDANRNNNEKQVLNQDEEMHSDEDDPMRF